MKIKSILLGIAFIALTGCTNSDDDQGNDSETVLTGSEVPAEINTYVSTHFSTNTVNRVVKDVDGNTLTYDVYLSGNVILEFNEAITIISIDGTSKLPDSVIPKPILDYVAKNYPNNVITDWELENNHQQVELDNNTELEFTMSGEFIRVDNN